jgi:flagellar hook-basal body complex protein FliE
VISPLLAAKAYAAVQSSASEEPGAAAGPAGAPDFGQILNKAMSDVVQTGRHAETQMVAGVQGKANLVDVVTALSSAETSLETLVSVRDQVISAYQEIMRMQI